ncbi:MAG: MarR family transcriptional regulator [Spirochaetales bacterium]|nr:MarR family transcriptional regulator [Spirochaetales bacterium]
MKKNIIEIGKKFSQIDRHFKLFLKTGLKSEGLGSSEGLALLVLSTSEAVSQDSLVRELALDKSVIARTVASLEEKGLVFRNKSQEDSRTKLVSISAEGSIKCEKVIYVLNQWSLQIFNGFTDEVLESMNRRLDEIIRNTGV